MRQISDGAVHTTEGLSQIRKAAEDLRRAATGLQQQVARFRI
jgi:methyl-accepting chemotaxis protein